MPNLLERVEELHRRVTELEQQDKACTQAHRDTNRSLAALYDRLPKPIPVVEPLAERVIRDAHEACGESPVFVEAEQPCCDICQRRIKDLKDGWKERAERAEALVAESRERIIDLLSTEGTMGGFKAREQARVFIDLARARVAKAGP